MDYWIKSQLSGLADVLAARSDSVSVSGDLASLSAASPSVTTCVH